jgi:hypothetical protein
MLLTGEYTFVCWQIRIFFNVRYSTLLHPSAAPQIPLCRRTLGSKPELLLRVLRH